MRWLQSWHGLIQCFLLIQSKPKHQWFKAYAATHDLNTSAQCVQCCPVQSGAVNSHTQVIVGLKTCIAFTRQKIVEIPVVSWFTFKNYETIIFALFFYKRVLKSVSHKKHIETEPNF